MKRKVPTGRGSVEQVSHHARAPRYAALRAMASSREAELAKVFPTMFSTDSGATPKKKQRTLEALAFKPMSPEDEQQRMQVEDEEHKTQKLTASQEEAAVEKKASEIAAMWQFTFC